MHRICVFLLILSAAPQALEARASERARSKADAWVGREASELLMQLRVDGGRVRIDEIEATGETTYTWSSWNPAWVEEINDVELAPIGAGLMQQSVYTEEVQHAASHRCDVTFFADVDGIVRKWEFTGSRCGTDIQAPKGR